MLMERVAGCWWNDWPDVGGTRGRMAWNTHSVIFEISAAAFSSAAATLFALLRAIRGSVFRSSLSLAIFVMMPVIRRRNAAFSTSGKRPPHARRISRSASAVKVKPPSVHPPRLSFTASP